jgi:hypothetical protein
MRLQINKEKLKKVLIGAVIAGLGALLTYILQYVSSMDFGQWSPVIVALCSILINLIRKIVII